MTVCVWLPCHPLVSPVQLSVELYRGQEDGLLLMSVKHAAEPRMALSLLVVSPGVQVQYAPPLLFFPSSQGHWHILGSPLKCTSDNFRALLV